MVAALFAAWLGMTWLAVHRGRSTAEQPLEPVWNSVQKRVVEAPSADMPASEQASETPPAVGAPSEAPVEASRFAAMTPPTGTSMVEAPMASPSNWPRTGPALGGSVDDAASVPTPYPRTDAPVLTAGRPLAEFEGTIRSPQFRAQHEHHGQGVY